MRKFLRNLYLTRISFGIVAALLPCAASSVAQGQQPPLVYTMENTGASYPAPILPDFAHTPINRQLPDPFVFSNGTRDTSWDAFEQHRNEWKKSIEQNEIGEKPDCHDCTITAVYVPTSTTKGTLTVTITRNGHTMTLPAAVVLPAATGGPFPYVMGMGGATGSMPASMFTGIATVVYNLNNVTKYTGGGNAGSASGSHVADAFYVLYPEYCAGFCNAANGYPNGSNHGQYAAWTWGVSRLIDGIQIAAQATTNPLPLDTTHSAVTGCSYAGKMAMWSGALDERIALTIAQENGGGGAPSWRVSHEIETQGSVENINDTSYEWFGSQMHQFDNAGVYKMPTDHHELMAMVAPRAMVQTGDSLYYWLGDRSATFDSLATKKVYDAYGIGDRFGYYIDANHNHCVVPAYQITAIQPYINRFLKGQNVDTNLAVSWQLADALQPGSQPTIDSNMWTGWWGTDTPAYPANAVWNNGYNIELPLNQNLTINSGDTVATSYAVSMPGTHAAATVTYPYGLVESDVACSDGTSYTIAIPLANQVFTIPANDNTLHASNPGSAVNPGCSNGSPGHTTATYFYALGKQNPGAGNPGLAGFITTNGTQATAQTDPLAVTFSFSDSTTGQGGGSAPLTTLNAQNPYSCTPPGCPVTPTLNWSTPSGITYGTALSSTQLNATASSTTIATQTGGNGLLAMASLPGTFSYSPATGTVLGAGTHMVSVTFTPTGIGTKFTNYTIATATVPVTVAKANQTITFTGLPASVTAGSPVSFALNGTASSGLPVTYTVSGPATVSGTTLTTTATGAGTISVTASQAGNGNYNAATPVTQTIAVGTVQLVSTAVLSFNGSAYQAVVTVVNNGTATAQNVQLTAATLGAGSATSLPASFDTIPNGGSASVTLTFPASAGAHGAPVVEKLTGTYTGGTFGGSFRATLP